MPEEVIFSSKEYRDIGEVADFLIQIGEKLKSQGSFNLSKGSEQVEVKPTGPAKLDLKYEIEDNEKHEFEVEIKWKPNQASAGKVNIS